MTGLLDHRDDAPLRFDTHAVTNQPPPLDGYDPLACDPGLVDALARELVPDGAERLGEVADVVGSAEGREHARLANAYEPVLRTHDRYGVRVDEVEFHPSWHWLMDVSVRAGNTGGAWTAAAEDSAHVLRAASFYLMSQLEQGHCCPITMSYAAVPALRNDPELAARYEPGLRSTTYDPGTAEPSTKAGLLAGMSMTEKQGGSDVRSGTTVATPSASYAADGTYTLLGHKWFTSAPMNDLFLTLAQAPGGLTCFVLPRVLPDGSRNPIRIQRLKDKLGNRSNASAEIEYQNAIGWRLGAEGRGVRTIIEMVTVTRLDCVLGSAAIMRAAVTEATHHAAHRSAFGTRLADAPLMRTVLVELAAESEAATRLGLRLAGAVDRRATPSEAAFLRLALPISKYLVCKRTAAVVAEAQECLGGNGYIEESGLPRLYREAPLNSIWEGSGNVTALDVLRAVTREPDTVEALLDEVDAALGAHPAMDRAARALRSELTGALRAPDERRARRIAELAGICLQGSLLIRHAPIAVAEVFFAGRVDGLWRTSGTGMPSEPACAEVLERVTPQL
jgi:putative acyl-CoA dehydrogenase